MSRLNLLKTDVAIMPLTEYFMDDKFYYFVRPL